MFLIERESIKKKTGEFSREIAPGVTSRSGWPRATRPRRFAVGILKSFQKPSHGPKPAPSIAELMRKLSFRPRLIFGYLRMTKNSTPVTCSY